MSPCSSTTSSSVIKSMTTIICVTPPFHCRRESVQKTGKFHVFMFILALVEVNARLAVAFFTKSPTMNQLEFRRKLARELLEYSYALHSGGRVKRKRDTGVCPSICGVETAPPYASLWTGMERLYLSSKHGQHTCRMIKCQKRIRTYCRCMIGHWMCPTCIGIHIASNNNDS
jgi:hypothetical protein